MADMGVHYSSADLTWETPQPLFDLLHAEFEFTLDVCATPATAKCAKFFTPQQDGLAQAWGADVCWLNPPYGREIGRWMEKAVRWGRHTTVVCLVPARTDTRWWWETCLQGQIRFLKGRLRFGDGKAGAPFPSAVIVFGPRVAPRVVWWDWQAGGKDRAPQHSVTMTIGPESARYTPPLSW